MLVDMKIMLVDDEELFLTNAQLLLSRKGYDVIIATSGEEALQKLSSTRIDLIVLDVKMPGMDGLTALKEIKKQHPTVEVIMLTGHATIDSAIEGLNSGAYDYCVKPCDIYELLKKAQEALEKRKILEEEIRGAKHPS
jgi:DNA-binding NtrC family response regulator